MHPIPGQLQNMYDFKVGGDSPMLVQRKSKIDKEYFLTGLIYSEIIPSIFKIYFPIKGTGLGILLGICRCLTRTLQNSVTSKHAPFLKKISSIKMTFFHSLISLWISSTILSVVHILPICYLPVITKKVNTMIDVYPK